jgi:hypothetical protein
MKRIFYYNVEESNIMRKVMRIVVLMVSCLSLGLSAIVYAASYDHEIVAQKMTFSWKVDGANLHIKLSAPTKGWVGIGFNPSKEMKDAKIVLGYVQNEKTVLSDEFGIDETKHESVETLGGKSDVTLVDGNEKNGTTTIEFTLPLVSTDSKGCTIDPMAETTVLLAYGADTKSFKIKHKYRTRLNVNLATGKFKQL